MKTTHKKKIVNKEDRNWIKPPNLISKKDEINSLSKISYWVDRTNEVQLYTPEQLAKCNILMNMNLLLSKSFTLIQNLQKIDKDITVGTLIQQEYAQFKTSESSVYAYFVQMMAATPDITFAEFLGFISQENNPNALSKLGKKKLEKVIKDTDSDVKNFFKSDRLKKG